MKALLDIKRFKLYGWIGLAFLSLDLLTDVAQHTGRFPAILFHDIWLTIYITVLDYIWFEYTLPRLRWKNFLASLFLVLIHIFLYPECFFLFLPLGLQLHVHILLLPP